MDIFQIEQRGMFSPPNGNHPQMLPDYWRPSRDEEVRTDLPELSDAELSALGWKGPIQMPPLPGTSYFTHSYEWDTETREWISTELDQYQKEQRVNYQKFWDDLINTGAYATIKSLAKQSLEVNTIATEFIALLGDAKSGKANVTKIQEVLTDIITSIPFTQEELAEIQTAFTEGGLYSIYSLS